MTETSELTNAIYRRDAGAVADLLREGAEPSFFEAAALADATTVSKYLDEDPSLSGQFSPDGFTAMHLAAFFGHSELVTLLADRGSNPDARSQNAMDLRPIHSAAASGNANVLNALLAYAVDVNAKQERGFTALHEAALNGNVEMIRALLAKGADAAIACGDGRTALDFAEGAGHADAATVLRTANA